MNPISEEEEFEFRSRLEQEQAQEAALASKSSPQPSLLQSAGEATKRLIAAPIEAAKQSIHAGAVGIVCHLREDRRHIRDADVYALRRELNTKLDLEMAAHEEIIRIAEDVKPELVTIVPEKREELTTEGGLNIAADPSRYAELVQRMHALGIEVSFFIEPDSRQVETAQKIGADIIELHTGTYADAKGADAQIALESLILGGSIAVDPGLS